MSSEDTTVQDDAAAAGRPGGIRRPPGFDSGHPTAHWPQIPEEIFNATQLYRDNRGYVWQRGRNGHWRSTDGLDAGPGVRPPDGRWAPYRRIVEIGRLTG